MNFFKVLNYEKGFIKTNVIVVIIGVILDIIALVVFSSMNAIAIASLFTFLVWYIISDHALKKKMGLKNCKSDWFVLFATAVYFAGVFLNTWIGLAVYYLLLVALALIFRRFYNGRDAVTSV